MKTTSKELSQRLADALNAAGYDFNPEQRWMDHPNMNCALTRTEYDYFNIREIYRYHFEPGYDLPEWDELPARFTMSELMDMLPDAIYTEGSTFRKALLSSESGWVAAFIRMSNQNTPIYYTSGHGATECSALARLIMWMIKTGHVINLPTLGESYRKACDDASKETQDFTNLINKAHDNQSK